VATSLDDRLFSKVKTGGGGLVVVPIIFLLVVVVAVVAVFGLRGKVINNV
jgi:hypothetical protein